MKNDQVNAARKVMNPFRAAIKLETVQNEDGSETLTPYRTTNPALRGTPVTVTKETSSAEVARMFQASLRSVPQDA